MVRDLNAEEDKSLPLFHKRFTINFSLRDISKLLGVHIGSIGATFSHLTALTLKLGLLGNLLALMGN